MSWEGVSINCLDVPGCVPRILLGGDAYIWIYLVERVGDRRVWCRILVASGSCKFLPFSMVLVCTGRCWGLLLCSVLPGLSEIAVEVVWPGVLSGGYGDYSDP